MVFRLSKSNSVWGLDCPWPSCGGRKSQGMGPTLPQTRVSVISSLFPFQCIQRFCIVTWTTTILVLRISGFASPPPPIVEVMLLSLCLHVANTHGRYPELATSASSNDGQAGVWDKVLLSRHRLSFLPFFLCSPTKANVSPTCINLQFHGLIYSPPALPGCSSNKSITFQRTMSSAYHGISFRINTILCAPYKVGVSLSVADDVFSTITTYIWLDSFLVTIWW